jgi:hypothetical protein
MEKTDFKSWIINIVSEGLGAAFGIAIVGFVAYTVVGVYQIHEKQSDLDKRYGIIEERQSEIETSIAVNEGVFKNMLDKRSKELREEIIKSNQVALDVVLDKDEVEDDDPPLLSPKPTQSIERDALKHRFREAQQHIQQQTF